MATNISLNQFAPNSPQAGMYVYMANLPQLHNVIVSANQETALAAGAVVTIDGAVANANAPVAKQAAVTDAVFGVVTYNPVKATYAAGEKIAIARANDVVFMPAAGAITAGSTLYFNAANQVAAAGDSVIGRALTSAAGAGDYVQVELGFAE